MSTCVRADASSQKSLNYQRIGDTSVRFITEQHAPEDHGTRTAKGAFAMMNVSNILLLDEEDLMREATALLLGNRGTSVTKTATIDEAITQLERRTYDVVIVDIRENGHDPVTWLQRLVSKVSSTARVIVCTEKPLPKIDPTGISHVLVKPYPFDQLVEAVFASRSTPLRYTRPSVKSVARRSAMHRRTPMLMRRGRA